VDCGAAEILVVEKLGFDFAFVERGDTLIDAAELDLNEVISMTQSGVRKNNDATASTT
jgi:hypothetical protein